MQSSLNLKAGGGKAKSRKAEKPKSRKAEKPKSRKAKGKGQKARQAAYDTERGVGGHFKRMVSSFPQRFAAIPAKAGIQSTLRFFYSELNTWIPAFAGMTVFRKFCLRGNDSFS
jgi:hypothetical protein